MFIKFKVGLYLKNKKRKNKIVLPFWLQILAIIVVGIIFSVVVFLIISSVLNKDKESNVEKHSVTFAYQDGTVIDTKKASDGKGIFPPDFETNGVFRGWSGAINNVTSDIEVHPILMDISDENLFYFDSLYVKEGDEFAIDLLLAGEVNLSSADLTVSYDTDVMEYVKSDSKDYCEIKEGEEGVLNFILSSDIPITEKTLLSQITFRSKEMDVYASQIDLSCKNGKIVKEGKEQPTTVSTINNKIYYLQEVE